MKMKIKHRHSFKSFSWSKGFLVFYKSGKETFLCNSKNRKHLETFSILKTISIFSFFAKNNGI